MSTFKELSPEVSGLNLTDQTGINKDWVKDPHCMPQYFGLWLGIWPLIGPMTDGELAFQFPLLYRSSHIFVLWSRIPLPQFGARIVWLLKRKRDLLPFIYLFGS